jgi:hypothetical protein
VTPLVKVELTRLWWRRAVRVLLLLGILLPAAVFVIRVYDTQPKSVEAIIAENGEWVLDEIQDCERNPGAYDVDVSDPDFHSACTRQVTRWYGNSPLDLVEEREQGGAIAAMVLITMLMLLAGTTFAGHDWNTGSMSNQLLFEPRRERVWLAKALAVGLVTGALALAVLAAYWTGMYAVASMRDLTIPDHAMTAAYKQAVLGGAFAAAAGTFGYVLTMLLRSTVGTLGLLFAVAFFCIVFVAGVLGLGGGTEAIMPWGNFYAYAVGGYEYFDYDECGYGTANGPCGQNVITRSEAVIYFGAIWLLVGVPSLLGFRSRDLP